MIDRENLKTLCRRYVKSLPKYSAHRHRLIYIVGLVFLSILLLLPLFFHHRPIEKLPSREIQEPVNFHASLEDNLKKLQQYNESDLKKDDTSQNIFHPSPLFSKEYRVRQNAPTRAFELGSVASNDSSSNMANTNTFLDHSSYANFANQISQAPRINAATLQHPDFTVAQGEFIHAVIETAVNSDMPGMIRAVITRPVYSYLNNRLLIPAGSRLIGQYSSQTLQGINRVMVIWQRLLLPNGIFVQVDSPGSDDLGEAGFPADDMNTHFFQRFGMASLLSLLGAASATWGVDDNAGDNSIAQYRTAISESFQSSAGETLNRTVAIKPTLRIHQGTQVIVFVARDLDFYLAFRATNAN